MLGSCCPAHSRSPHLLWLNDCNVWEELVTPNRPPAAFPLPLSLCATTRPILPRMRPELLPPQGMGTASAIKPSHPPITSVGAQPRH